MVFKPYACSDGFCGADDCPRCRPGNFDSSGQYIDPDREDECEHETKKDVILGGEYCVKCSYRWPYTG